MSNCLLNMKKCILELSNWLEKMRLASQKWELQETIHVQRKNPSVAKKGRLASTMEGTKENLRITNTGSMVHGDISFSTWDQTAYLKILLVYKSTSKSPILILLFKGSRKTTVGLNKRLFQSILFWSPEKSDFWKYFNYIYTFVTLHSKQQSAGAMSYMSAKQVKNGFSQDQEGGSA